MKSPFVAVALIAAVPAVTAHAATPIEPGQWEMRSVVTAVNMPGAPPQMLQMMRKPQVIRYCITQEQAANGPRELLNRSGQACKFTRYSFAGGKVDAVMQCNSTERGAMTATTKGDFTPVSYNTTSTMVMNGPQGKMTMSSTGQGKRLGPCAKGANANASR